MATPGSTPRVATVLPELAGVRRPRLRADCPILWRDATTVSLGGRAVVPDVTQAQVSWLAGLDGMRDRAQLVADLPIPATDAGRLLRAAIAAAALEDAADLPPSIRWASPAGRPQAWARFGAAIDTYGAIDAAYAVLAARTEASVVVTGSGPVAVQVRTALELAGLRVVEGSRPSVTVLADLTYPDAPGVVDVDGPHLPVTTWGRRAVVGPLVDPGRSGCLRCAALHRRDADPAWPLLAVQWARAVATVPCPPIDPLLTALAAANAAALVRAWVDDPDGDWAGQAVELTLPTGRRLVRPRPPHPLCGCTWARSG